MKPTSNNTRYLRVSKLRFVFWMILLILLFVRTLYASDTAAPDLVSAKQSDGRNFSPISAQRDTTQRLLIPKSYWFDLGLGWGGQGAAFNIGFSYEIAPKRILSIHYSGVQTRHRYYDYVLFFAVENYPAGEDAGAVEITYGFLNKGNAGIINFSAGLSLVNIRSGTGEGPPTSVTGLSALFGGSSRPANYKLGESRTVGLALRAQFIPSLRWAGLGISPYVNINAKYSYASITAQLALGWIRPKVRKA